MSDPVVTVREGKLRGAVKHLADGSEFYSFKGIPYARPPVGILRFKAPVPPTPWNGIFDALEHGPVCPQKSIYTTETIEGSENCLFLNVYTRSLEADSKLPVMIYIHGGAFRSGSGDSDVHGPEFLLQHDVVLVTINYRLEVFGFLCLDIPEVPGNAGLKDQVAAFKWVQNNIAQFGGDPKNVTLFGESAGASSATYHMVSPMSKGLFHKAIAKSGTFLTEWSFQTNAKERAFSVGKYLGKDTNNPHDLLQFLQSVPSKQLINITSKVATDVEKKQGPMVLFCPVVEEEFPNFDAFLAENPMELLLSKKVESMPLLAGFNSAEGLLFAKSFLQRFRMKIQASFFVPKNIADKIPEKVAEYDRFLQQNYFGDEKVIESDIETVTKLQTDRIVLYPVHRFVYFYANCCDSVYMYRFNLDTELNIIKKMIGYESSKGACHGDELFYIFKNANNSKYYEQNVKLRGHIDMMTKFLTDFAKTGNPTPDNRWNIKWEPYTVNRPQYLRIDKTLSMGKDDEKHRLDIWNKLYLNAGMPSMTKSNL